MAQEHAPTPNPLFHTARGNASLITMIMVAVTLLATWLWGPTRASWDAVDLLVFRTLNNTLPIASGWQSVWAFMNSRVFDGIAAIVLVALLLTAYWERRVGIAAIVSLAVVILALVVGRHVGTEMIVTDYFGYQRPSPSLTVENCHRLSTLVPTIISKDASPWSFPGDHGFVVFGMAIYMSFWAHRRTANAAWIFAAVVMLPRLLSGGHWLTDVMVGSLSMALLTMSLVMATGLHDSVVAGIMRLFDDGSATQADNVAEPAAPATIDSDLQGQDQMPQSKVA